MNSTTAPSSVAETDVAGIGRCNYQPTELDAHKTDPRRY